MKFSELQKYIRSYEINVGKTEVQPEDTEIVINVGQVNQKYNQSNWTEAQYNRFSGTGTETNRRIYENRAKNWRQDRPRYDPKERGAHEGYNRQYNSYDPANSKNLPNHRQSQGSNTRPYNNWNGVPRLHMNASCKYCKRFGHVISECRGLLRLCYVCGEGDHMARDCPRHRSRRNSLQNGTNQREHNRPRTQSLNQHNPQVNFEPPQ